MDKVSSVVSGICAVLGTLGITLGIRWLRSVRFRPQWMPVGRLPAAPIQCLIKAQRITAEQSAYEPWRIGQPPLDEIYVEQEAEATMPERAPAEAARFDVQEMLATFSDVVVVGGPGTGKSTMAKNLVRESTEYWSAVRRFRRSADKLSGVVAVRVSGPGLAEAGGDTLAEALAGHFTGRGLPLDARTFRRQPARGADWLIIVDGVDEIQSAATRARLLALIRHELTSRSRVMRLLITSRSPLEAGIPATELRLCVFDDGRLERFAGKWFRCHRNPDPRGEAARFLTRFGSGPLANLIRVPLMAAMAAVIHEFDRAARLPTSRTELYEQFVDVIRRSRGPLPELACDEASTWLAANLDQLLMVAAREAVRSGPGSLFPAVAAYCAGQAPEPTKAWLSSAEGRDVLRERLIATSLVMSDGVILTFIHHSIAEFLAASAQPVDLPRWLADLGDPATRSFRLFCVARAGLAGTGIHALLDGPVSDPVRAGHLLLDGAAVDPSTQWRVVTELGTCLLTGGATAGDALTLLAGIAAVDHQVAGWLTTMASSSRTPPWPRTLISDKIANVDAELGERLLIEVAADRRVGTASRRWAAHRLMSRGNPMGRHLLTGVANWCGPATPADETGTSLTTVADQQIAMDRRHSLDVRAEAALRLIGDPRNDDPRLHDVLQRICHDGSAPSDIRRKAAVTVARRRGAAGIKAIQDLLRDPSTPADAVTIVVGTITTRTDSDAVGLLHAAALDPTVPLTTRASILATARHTYDCRLPQDLALDPTADPDLRTEAVRFFRDSGGGHSVMHALCTDRDAPRRARALVIDTIRHASCPDDSRLLLRVATDPKDDNLIRFHAVQALLERDEPGAEAVLRDMATGRNADWWLALNAAGLLRTTTRCAPPAEAPQRPAPPVAATDSRPDRPDRPDLPSDPIQLRRLVARASVKLDLRKRAASALLAGADSTTMQWLIGFAWDHDEEKRDPEDLGWLQHLVVDHLIGRPGSLDRCRAMVLDRRYDPRTRGRLALYLVRTGEQSDLTRVRPLAVDTGIDIRAREVILEALLQRREPDDLVVIVEAALQPGNARLAQLAVRDLLAVGEHNAVRRLWRALWHDRYDHETRLAIGETLAYSGSPADHDELRRLISAADVPPPLRLRLAEILSHRGDRWARAVLRALTCDSVLPEEMRAKALALIAVPREEADVHAVRRVALDYSAPEKLRRSAIHGLAGVGTTSELNAIRAIGQDPKNSAELRRLAGEMLAQQGDLAGLMILGDLTPPGPQAPGRLRRIREIVRR